MIIESNEIKQPEINNFYSFDEYFPNGKFKKIEDVNQILHEGNIIIFKRIIRNTNTTASEFLIDLCDNNVDYNYCCAKIIKTIIRKGVKNKDILCGYNIEIIKSMENKKSIGQKYYIPKSFVKEYLKNENNKI